MEYGLFGLLVLIANIYAIYQIFISAASTGAKVLWTVAILLLPILGFILWLIFGPKGSSARV
ncbi:MAG: PLDc N-terminal domain-containing protein [Paracoccaceae bacterium]